jgi:Mn-containing catalase
MAFQVKGDIITDLNEDLAAEMKARTMYDNVLRLVDDPDVREPIKFLRAREVVHYQRFAEALGIAQERAECKTNFYLTNPSFDKNCAPPCAADTLYKSENKFQHFKNTILEHYINSIEVIPHRDDDNNSEIYGHIDKSDLYYEPVPSIIKFLKKY